MSTDTPTRPPTSTSVHEWDALVSSRERIAKERDATTIMPQRRERDAVRNSLPGNPAIPSKDDECYFFRIPLELRYMIYHYALSYEEGLTYKYVEDDTTFKLYPIIDAEHEVNRLKYVNHQFCMETTGLAIRVNDLEFLQTSPSNPEPGRQFLSFMKNCTEKNKKSMRKISVNRSYATFKDCAMSKLSPEISDSTYAVVLFCTAYPKSYVHFTHSMRYEPDGNPQLVFYVRGCYLQMLYRHRNMEKLVPDLAFRTSLEAMAQAHRARQPPSGLNLPNIRYWLADAFDESAFRNEWQSTSNGYYARRLVGNVEGGLDTMVNEAREWYENGI